MARPMCITLAMSCGCGLQTAGTCAGGTNGLCPVVGLPCAPETLGVARNRAKARLLDAWKHMAGGNTPLVVTAPGRHVEPLTSDSDRSTLAAEALSWFRRYARAAPGSTQDEENRALGLWLGTQSGMTDESKDFYLRQRAGDDPKALNRLRQQARRQANRALDRIVAGLVRDGVEVLPPAGEG